MKTYRAQSRKYIVLEESYTKDSVLGLTTNQLIIVVNKDNKIIEDFSCPEPIWQVYKEQMTEAKRTPDYQLCLYFGEQVGISDDDL